MSNDIYVVGLTGPTGAGKSTAASILSRHGIKIIDADKAARDITAPGCYALAELSRAFGSDIIRADGTLDRSLLASRAFSDEKRQRLLNDITHPFITMSIRRAVKALSDAGEKIAVIDAPLLFESGVDIICDKTIAVISEPGLRLGRIISRDRLDESAARQRMSVQRESDYYSALADIVIENNGSLSELEELVGQAEQEIRRAADEARL